MHASKGTKEVNLITNGILINETNILYPKQNNPLIQKNFHGSFQVTIPLDGSKDNPCALVIVKTS